MRSFRNEFQMSQKTVTCLLNCHVTVSSFSVMMAISRWPFVTWVTGHTENIMFCLQLWSGWQTSNLCRHYWSGHSSVYTIFALVLHQDTWNNVLDNTRHVQVVRILWQVSWLILAAAAMTSCTIWEWLAYTNIAASWILSSVLTVLG
jgi:hypothetical protein